MNAVNPAPAAPPAGGDQRLYEPSMEEILASIRRIIADDQMLPGRAARREVSPADEAQHATAEAAVAPASASIPHRQSPPIAEATIAPSLPMPAGEPAEVKAPLVAMAPHGKLPTSEIPTLRASMQASPEASTPVTEAAVSSATGVEATRAAVRRPELHARDTATPAFLADAEPIGKGAEDAGFEDEADGIDPYFDPPIERDETLPQAEPPAGLFSPNTKQSVASAFNVLAATRLADNSEELLGLAREMIRPLLKTWLDDNLPSMVERLVRAEIERVARGGR